MRQINAFEMDDELALLVAVVEVAIVAVDVVAGKNGRESSLSLSVNRFMLVHTRFFSFVAWLGVIIIVVATQMYNGS